MFTNANRQTSYSVKTFYNEEEWCPDQPRGVNDVTSHNIEIYISKSTKVIMLRSKDKGIHLQSNRAESPEKPDIQLICAQYYQKTLQL